MGKVASPNVGYCSGFPEGSLSVNGKIFSTENPPISYTIDGLTATVSDAMGVLGTADLTGKLVPVNEQLAIAEIEYCEGKPKAKLSWSSGSKTTENTPISFTLTSNNDFTGGQCEGVNYYVQVFIDYDDGTLNFPAYQGFLTGAITSIIVTNEFNPQTNVPPLGVLIRVFYAGGTLEDYSWFRPVTGALSHIVLTRVDGNPDNCGNPSNNWTLNVNDSTGQIAAYEYLEEPINFRVTCFDYDIKEASYACQGECPAGTEFQCICPETNTLTCYGFDPDNPDIFKPLFTSPITP